MDHLLVPDVQNIIIGLLDHITQQRLSLVNKAFKRLLPVHDPTVWEFEFRKRQQLALPSFLRKGGCTVYWGDGTVNEYIVKKRNITIKHYFKKGTYKICIFANTDNTLFSSSLFNNTCKYMKSFIRLGKGLNNLSNLFFNCEDINIPLNHLNTSRVVNMSGMFSHAKRFNQPLEKWNVSNVTNMEDMFICAHNFNHPLENWNVINVINMSGMFCEAKKFNQPLEKWNVSNVTNMSFMFSNAFQFNQPLENWDVSNVTNMYSMFCSAKKFNQSLEKWNVSNVIDMSEMFSGAVKFNQPLKKWNMSNVIDISFMFKDASSFNQSLEEWDANFTHAFESFENCPITPSWYGNFTNLIIKR